MNEKELLEKVAAGDEQAYRQLFHHHWDNIYGLAYAFTKSSAMAEDLVQEIFIKIWQERHRLREIQKFESYLFIIARNYIFTALKKQRRDDAFRNQVHTYFDANRSMADQHLIAKDTREMIIQAIGRRKRSHQKYPSYGTLARRAI